MSVQLSAIHFPGTPAYHRVCRCHTGELHTACLCVILALCGTSCHSLLMKQMFNSTPCKLVPHGRESHRRHIASLVSTALAIPAFEARESSVPTRSRPYRIFKLIHISRKVPEVLKICDQPRPAMFATTSNPRNPGALHLGRGVSFFVRARCSKGLMSNAEWLLGKTLGLPGFWPWSEVLRLRLLRFSACLGWCGFGGDCREVWTTASFCVAETRSLRLVWYLCYHGAGGDVNCAWREVLRKRIL